MIIDQVDVEGVLAVEAENDAPVGAQRDRPKTLQVSLQRMQAKARNRHVLRTARLVQAGQDAGDLVGVLRVEFAAVVILEQPPQSLVPETQDHE